MKKREEIPAGYIRVTTVLQPYSTLGALDPAMVANAADRGTRVHAYCESYALGLLVPQVDDDCKNYFEAFQRWFDQMVAEVIWTEKRMNHKGYKLSGSADMIVRLVGDKGLTLLDIKTPASTSQSWNLQTAAYRILAREVLGVETERRMCLMLPKRGDSARIVEFTQHSQDEDMYLGALKLFRHFFGSSTDFPVGKK